MTAPVIFMKNTPQSMHLDRFTFNCESSYCECKMTKGAVVTPELLNGEDASFSKGGGQPEATVATATSC